MIKRGLTLALTLICMLGAYAQQPNPIPLDSKVKHGVLPNGLTYSILHNEEPKQRANFYIAQKVGSSLEEPQQLGLAHFLEHMAFNGTKHYPGKDMLNYLQSKGLRFGADINAYTGFDETVYNIDNVNTTNQALMDSVLLVLRDWSCDILLEDDEIDAERKVIQEEWRSRNDASTRFYTAMLPVIYKERQYQQMPIGTMDVVMNFPYKDLRDYYHKWYRPDQQGIVIVGDFDVDEMEKKVIALFSDIPMDPNAAPREYPVVSDNEEPIYFAYEDPEWKNPQFCLSIKMDKIPYEYRNTDMAMVQKLVYKVFCDMIQNRLNDFRQDPSCDYSFAQVDIDDFFVSCTKDAFTIFVIPTTDMQAAVNDALSIIFRACKTGFNQSELDRVTEELLSSYEKRYNERDKTNTSVLARQLIRNFVDNSAYPGIETEYEMLKSILPMLPVAVYNQIGPELLTPTNQVVFVAQPKADEYVLPTKEMVVGQIEALMNQEYEAYVDEVITEPLIAQLPAKGSVKSQKEGEFGTTEIILSNGVKVIVKTTDFKADEIQMQAFKKGGLQAYPASQASNVKLLEDAVQASKFGPFDNKTLPKYLAGKNVDIEYGVGNITNYINGSSSVKDFPTLMELIYTLYTNINPDKETYDNNINKIRPIFANQEKNPMFTFQKNLSQLQYGNNPLKTVPTVETLDEANYDEMLAMFKESVANAADYTFVFTGNIDVDTLIPYLEQYIATLPATTPSEAKVVTPIKTPTGKVDNIYDIEMETPMTIIFGLLSDVNLPNDVKSEVVIDILGDVLGNVYIETIREKEGGAYSPSAYGQYDPVQGTWNIIYVIQTNAEQAPKMIQMGYDEIINVLQNGTTAEQFSKVKGAAINQYENSVRTNDYWGNQIRMKELLGKDYATDRKATLENLTLEEFNAILKNLYNGNNQLLLVQNGIAKANN